jgi:hypothetical protein
VQLAVFTIDSLITAGAKAGDFPGSIVLVIDETKGGDAIVAARRRHQPAKSQRPRRAAGADA